MSGDAMQPMIVTARQHWAGNSFVPRHMHVSAYAALVLAGEYEECGWQGRLRARPGDVLLHGRFDLHLDRFHRRGGEIINLEIGEGFPAGLTAGRIGDADAVVRQAERDPAAAKQLLLERIAAKPRASEKDWPELLAGALRCGGRFDLGGWARGMGLAPETVSRGFARMFGVSPSRYRGEWRARRALLRVVGGKAALSAIAAEAGFADQPHMTRGIRDMTGRTPGQWRRLEWA
jgi:AraC-like DNA-binding protein